MKLDKKRIRIICDYEKLLKDAIKWYNDVYKTDFNLVEYIKDEVKFAIIEYSDCKDSDLFDLGNIYGRKSEAFDKRLSSPPSSSFI